MIVRLKGRTYAGEIWKGEDTTAMSYSDYGTRIEVSINGRPATELKGRLASEAGENMGTSTGGSEVGEKRRGEKVCTFRKADLC